MWWVYYRIMLSSQISVYNGISDLDLYIYCQITIVEFVCEELRWIGMFYLFIFEKWHFCLGFSLCLKSPLHFFFLLLLFIYLFTYWCIGCLRNCSFIVFVSSCWQSIRYSFLNATIVYYGGEIGNCYLVHQVLFPVSFEDYSRWLCIVFGCCIYFSRDFLLCEIWNGMRWAILKFR